MLGGTNKITNSLSALYNAQSQDLAAIQTRIATGKKINTPSDDYAGYTKAQGYQNEIDGYGRVKQNLTDMKGYTSTAVATGSAIATALSSMYSLMAAYGNTTDATTQSGLSAQFEAQRNIIQSTISSAAYGGTKLYDAAANGGVGFSKTIDLDPNGGGNNFVMTFDAGTITVGGAVVPAPPGVSAPAAPPLRPASPAADGLPLPPAPAAPAGKARSSPPGDSSPLLHPARSAMLPASSA